jgi:hypothetical protein
MIPPTTSSVDEIRVHSSRKTDNFTIIDNAVLRNKALSFKARGLLCQLLSHRAGWVIRMSELKKDSLDGEFAIRGAIKELVAAGYMRSYRVQDAGGRLAGWRYEVFEEPITIQQFPTCGKTTRGKPRAKNTNAKNTNSEEDDTTLNPKGLSLPAEAVRFGDGEDTGIDAGDLAAMEEEQRAREAEGSASGSSAPADLLLDSEDDPKGKSFPWRQVMGALARIVPEVKMPTNGDRRDIAMKAFWRKHNKTVGCFEMLAEKVRASDYLMARNGHKGNDGKPYSWGWIFGRNAKNEVRADVIMAGGYSTESMAFVLEVQAKAAAPKMTKVMVPGGSTPFEVNLAEIFEGEPRYKQCDTHPNGTPIVIDYKN